MKFIMGDFYTKVVIYPKKTFAQMVKSFFEVLRKISGRTIEEEIFVFHY
jgi:hypothetical protein